MNRRWIGLLSTDINSTTGSAHSTARKMCITTFKKWCMSVNWFIKLGGKQAINYKITPQLSRHAVPSFQTLIKETTFNWILNKIFVLEALVCMGPALLSLLSKYPSHILYLLCTHGPKHKRWEENKGMITVWQKYILTC